MYQPNAVGPRGAFTVTSFAVSCGHLESLVGKRFAAGGLRVYFAGIHSLFAFILLTNNQSINQSIFYSISDTYSVIHIIHSKFTINKKQRRGEKDMFEAIQLISNIPWTIKFKL